MILRGARLLFLTLTAVPLLVAQTPPADEARPNIPIEQWLSGPDRQDFKWKVELSSPRLTFQQRNLVQVRAYTDIPTTTPSRATPGQGDQHDLYFVLKVADEKGNWLPDSSYNHYPLPEGLDKKKTEIQYSAGFYAKPGKYTAALILYDKGSGGGNVWRKAFEVRPPKADSLAGMDRDIPLIEFIAEVPNASPAIPRATFDGPNGRRTRYGGRGMGGVSGIGVISNANDEEWPPGAGREALPVRVSRPLRVDVVLNLAPHVNPNQRRNSEGQYRSVAGRMLQIAALLSHLDVEPGCVRVSAIDLSNLSVVLDRLDARTADWHLIGDEIHKIDHNTVSVDLLGNRHATAEFLRDYFGKLMGDSAGCGSDREKPARVILFVSHDFEFPFGLHGDHFAPEQQCACRLVHLRIGSTGDDDLDKWLKPANPERFDARTPEQFRKFVADLIAELSGGRERPR